MTNEQQSGGLVLVALVLLSSCTGVMFLMTAVLWFLARLGVIG